MRSKTVGGKGLDFKPMLFRPIHTGLSLLILVMIGGSVIFFVLAKADLETKMLDMLEVNERQEAGFGTASN